MTRGCMRGISPIRRFFLQCEITEEGCWLWKGATANFGYGVLQGDEPRAVKGFKQVRAHCLSFEFFNGPIPEDHQVCHRCDNPSCCNPHHLFAGTIQENRRDAVQKGRHTRGELQRSAVLTDKQVADIKQLLTDGQPPRAIARRFNANFNVIYDISVGHTWKHIPWPAESSLPKALRSA